MAKMLSLILNASVDDRASYGTTPPGASSDLAANASGFLIGLNDDAYWYQAGFHFAGATIPPGSVIHSAHLSLFGSIHAGAPRLRFYGEKQVNAADFTTTGPVGRALTTAYSDWTPAAGASSWRTYPAIPDLASIITEIIAQVGWASGNAINILAHGRSDLAAHDVFTAYSFDHTYVDGAPTGAKLAIVFTAPYESQRVVFGAGKVFTSGVESHSWMARSRTAAVPAEKLLIEYGWDRPTPDYVAAHISLMDASPFDGTGIQVVSALSSSDVLSQRAFQGVAFTEAMYVPTITTLASLTPTKMKHNFIRMGTQFDAEAPDWFADWATILYNAGALAKIAKQSGICDGILWDPESVGAVNPWKWTDLPAGWTTGHSLAETKAQIYLRGQEFMAAINAEFPNITILAMEGPSVTCYRLVENAQAIVDQTFGLFPWFWDGMCNAADAGTIIIDGRADYGLTLRSQFESGHTRALGASAYSTVPTDFVPHTRVGLTVWADYDARGEITEDYEPWDEADPYTGNKYNPALLQTVVKHALDVSDKYVWIYLQGVAAWPDSPDVRIAFDLPEPYWAALREAKGRPRPWVIDWGWASPSSGLFASTTAALEDPKFDGTAIEVFDGESTWVDLGRVWNPTPFTAAQYNHAITDLQSVTPARLRHSFIKIAAYRPAASDCPGWYDDAGWAAIAFNAGCMAKVAHDGGHCDGLVFDAETTGGTVLWCYDTMDAAWKLKAPEVDYTFAEMWTQVRKRGREFITAINAEYPNIVFFSLVGPSRTTPEADHGYGLLQAFFDGMAEGADAGTIIIDGCEQYGNATEAAYAAQKSTFRTNSAAYSQVPADYAAHVQCALVVAADWRTEEAPWDVDTPDDNYYTPGTFAQNLLWAARYSDRYMWVYSEVAPWWAVRDVPNQHIYTGEMPATYNAALAVCR